MTDEEIKKIAREVASKIEPKKGYGGESYWIRTSTEIIEKIVEDYCIVPKEQIYMRHGVAHALMEQDPARKEFYRGQSSVLESIFGKDMFEEIPNPD